jgi:hypothetical protein
MWRRQERLGLLLESRDVSEKPVRPSWLQRIIGQRYASPIHGPALNVESQVASLGSAFMPQAKVLDGLGPFSGNAETEMLQGGAQPAALYSESYGMPLDFGEGGFSDPVLAEMLSPTALCGDMESMRETVTSDSIGMVYAVGMLPEAAIQRIAMPTPQRTAIRLVRLIAMSGWRSPFVALGPVPVRALESFRDKPAEVRDGNRMLLSPLPVCSFPKISKLMYRRKSVDLQALDESERGSFLREAEVLRSIPVEKAELLGVFRSIPIENISRLRFVSSRNEIIYSLDAMAGRNSTRVHDMAAVRDTASQEVHLVPHRTRSRLVRLASARNGVQ